MNRKKVQISGFNNDDSSSKNTSPRAIREKRSSGSGGSSSFNGVDRCNYTPTSPKLSNSKIMQLQQETIIMNFSSSELTYKGSD